MATKSVLSSFSAVTVARSTVHFNNATARPYLARPYALKAPISSAPAPTPRPQFPVAADPFEPNQAPATSPNDAVAGSRPVRRHSPLKVAVVKAVARVLGYNTKSVTAIRETGTMCGAMVRAVETDREFWYTECGLPETYQSFFQLHLLYLLLLISRLRSLQNVSSAIPNTSTTASTYQTELLQHFFNLSENQMRQTLGAGERERTVKKYMQSMGEQWKGGGLGFDYALAKGQGNVLPREHAGVGDDGLDDMLGGDAELSSWVWRNLYSARFSDGIFTPPPSPVSSALDAPVEAETTEQDMAIGDLMLASNLQKITMFIRREVSRLEALTDEEVLSGKIGDFGQVDQTKEAVVETVDGA